jgi:hypothetical protein
MKNTSWFILLLLSIAACFASCKKSKDFIADESTHSGGYLPVSTNALVDMADNLAINARAYAAGASFKTELQFFSIDPVKEINLYETVGAGTKTKLTTWPYASAYSSIKKLDTLLVPYTVNATLASGTSIKLDFEILNLNTKSLVRTATIKVK